MSSIENSVVVPSSNKNRQPKNTFFEIHNSLIWSKNMVVMWVWAKSGIFLDQNCPRGFCLKSQWVLSVTLKRKAFGWKCWITLPTTKLFIWIAISDGLKVIHPTQDQTSEALNVYKKPLHVIRICLIMWEKIGAKVFHLKTSENDVSCFPYNFCVLFFFCTIWKPGILNDYL